MPHWASRRLLYDPIRREPTIGFGARHLEEENVKVKPGQPIDSDKKLTGDGAL